jgi:hypothetical protein
MIFPALTHNCHSEAPKKPLKKPQKKLTNKVPSKQCQFPSIVSKFPFLTARVLKIVRFNYNPNRILKAGTPMNPWLFLAKAVVKLCGTTIGLVLQIECASLTTSRTTCSGCSGKLGARSRVISANRLSARPDSLGYKFTSGFSIVISERRNLQFTNCSTTRFLSFVLLQKMVGTWRQDDLSSKLNELGGLSTRLPTSYKEPSDL